MDSKKRQPVDGGSSSSSATASPTKKQRTQDVVEGGSDNKDVRGSYEAQVQELLSEPLSFWQNLDFADMHSMVQRLCKYKFKMDDVPKALFTQFFVALAQCRTHERLCDPKTGHMLMQKALVAASPSLADRIWTNATGRTVSTTGEYSRLCAFVKDASTYFGLDNAAAASTELDTKLEQLKPLALCLDMAVDVVVRDMVCCANSEEFWMPDFVELRTKLDLLMGTDCTEEEVDKAFRQCILSFSKQGSVAAAAAAETKDKGYFITLSEKDGVCKAALLEGEDLLVHKAAVTLLRIVQHKHRPNTTKIIELTVDVAKALCKALRYKNLSYNWMMYKLLSFVD